MDPNAALAIVARYMDTKLTLSEQIEEVQNAAADLREWLARGGFAPSYEARGKKRAAFKLALSGSSLYARFFSA